MTRAGKNWASETGFRGEREWDCLFTRVAPEADHWRAVYVQTGQRSRWRAPATFCFFGHPVGRWRLAGPTPSWALQSGESTGDWIWDWTEIKKEKENNDRKNEGD